MANPAFMSIEGEVQGLLTSGAGTEDSVGTGFVDQHDDEFMVFAFDHEVFIPRDPHSGQPTGNRVHQPLTVTKNFDKCSPLLYNALTTGERLSRCELKFYRISAVGEEHFYTVVLENALIVGINATMPHVLDKSMDAYTPQERISLSYSNIVWTHVVAGTEGSDDWRIKRA